MSNIVEFVQNQVTLFNDSVSDDSITWNKESQFAIQAFQKNDYLAKIALSNPMSAQNAIINVAAIGITLNPASKLAYLVPRDGGVHLDISYMGLLHLAASTGSIKWGQCKLVHDNDIYESVGLDSAPIHKYNPFNDRGNVIGGYCTVKTADGDYLTEEMSLKQIKETEATSKAKKGPWMNHWSEMARKTIVKRASKYWPKVERLDSAIEQINSSEGEEFEPVMPHYSEKEVNDLHQDNYNLVSEKVGDYLFKMGASQNMNELKGEFAIVYKLTAPHKELQQKVQAKYIEIKSKLEQNNG